MRVIAGKFKNKDLAYPKDIRHSSQLHKKVVFDTIRPYLEESIFLDLYSGSGQIGIEALSQGATHCTFVDRSKDSIDAIQSNIQKCLIENDRYLVIQSGIDNFISDNTNKFDIIYVDPPYLEVEWSDFKQISKLLEKESIFILKYSPKNPPPDFLNLQIVKSKDSKDTNINFYQLK